MKKLLPIFFFFSIFFLFPLNVKAQESKDCIDLEEVYKEINLSSEAVTGSKNSIDAVKKINTTASLFNILAVFTGEDIFCIKDEELASKSTSLKKDGLLSMVNQANTMMFELYPDINVTQHLAEMFVPGYGTKNSTMAQIIDFGGGTQQDIDNANKTSGEVGDYFEDQIDNTTENAINSLPQNQLDYPETTYSGVSGYQYLKDVVQLDSIWKISSGIVYILFVLVFIVVGFMIMFRKRIASNVTVTISRALPNLILSLILVTFSFSIVGLIMDFGKISINISRDLFNNAYKKTTIQNSEIIEIKNVWNLANDAFKKTGTGSGIGAELLEVGIKGATYYFLEKAMPKIIEEFDIGVDTEVTVKSPVAEVTNEVLQPAVDLGIWNVKKVVLTAITVTKIGLIASIVKSLIILLICFYASIKLFITLLTTYLKLFINIILGPFQLLIGAIPGNSHFMTNWFKSVIANTLVFVGIFVTINAFTLVSGTINPAKFNFFGNSGVLWPDIIITFQGVIVIAGYLFASNLPKIINGALGVETNKNIIEATQNMKESVKKIPLVGGIFN